MNFGKSFGVTSQGPKSAFEKYLEVSYLLLIAGLLAWASGWLRIKG